MLTSWPSDDTCAFALSAHTAARFIALFSTHGVSRLMQSFTFPRNTNSYCHTEKTFACLTLNPTVV